MLQDAEGQRRVPGPLRSLPLGLTSPSSGLTPLFSWAVRGPQSPWDLSSEFSEAWMGADLGEGPGERLPLGHWVTGDGGGGGLHPKAWASAPSGGIWGTLQATLKAQETTE